MTSIKRSLRFTQLKKKFISLTVAGICSLSPFVFAQGIPHQFKEGGIISAEQMNENFQVAASKLRKGTVDCSNGETISDKLKEFNYLVIKGTCTENLNIDWLNRENIPESWDWDSATGISQFVLLTGDPSDGADGITAGNSDERSIYAQGRISVSLQDLTITGGRGIHGAWGAGIGLERVNVKNSSEEGLLISRGLGYVGASNFDGNQRGIIAENNASLLVRSSEILNSNQVGVGVWNGANAILGSTPNRDEAGVRDFSKSMGNTISGADTGVVVADSSFLKMMGNTIKCYRSTGVFASEASTLDLGIDWDQAALDDDGSDPLSYLNSKYSTNKLYYGNLIDGAECNSESRRNWHHGVQVREGSSMRISRTVIENNNQHGIYAEGNSSITLGGGNEIKNNGRHGFSLNETTLNQWSYQQELEPTFISGNGEDAFDLSSSIVHLNGGKVYDEFTGELIRASENRRFMISDHRVGINARNSRITLDYVDIRNNRELGIRLSDGSILNVWRGGANITGNGLNPDGWDGYAPGLEISRNSSASVDRVEISENGRGVQVDRNSSFNGGWKDENDTSLPEHMIVIANNHRSALGIGNNSNFDLRNVKLSENALTVTPNENGSIYPEDTITIHSNSVGYIRNAHFSGNGSNVINVRHNSHIRVQDSDITGNNLIKHINDNGDIYYWNLINIEDSAGADFRNTSITNNHGRVIRVQNRSKLFVRDSTQITGNGSLNNDTDSYRGIEIRNNSEINFENSKLDHNAEWTAIDIRNSSQGYFNNAEIKNSQGGGININDKSNVGFENSQITSTGGNGHGISLDGYSAVHLQDSTISATYEFDQQNNDGTTFTNGSNGIGASDHSRVNIRSDDVSNGLTTITGAAFPLKVRQNSELDIRSTIQLKSNLNWNVIQIEQGSSIYIGDEMATQSIGEIQLDYEAKAHFSEKWKISEINCTNHNDINGNPIYRSAVIYRNGADVTNISGDCILAN